MFAVGCVETPDLGVSDTVHAAIGSATVTMDLTASTFATPVTVTFAGLDGAATDGIAIAPQGSATMATGAAAPKPSVTTDAPSYTTFVPVGVNWAGLTGSAKDWIGLAPVGSGVTNVSTWVYTSGTVSGRTVFNTAALAPGSYVARAFANNSYTITTESLPFTVTMPVPSKVATDLSTYVVEQSIVVSWAGLPGNTKDWIGYAPEGSPATTVTRWLYTGGAKSGSRLIEGALAPGTYVARAFVNDSYNQSGESTSFVVQ